MATLIKHRNQYCSKIQKWNGVKQIATKIPLRTNQKDVAVVRHHRVEQAEKHIKEGIIKKHQFNDYFAWLNDEGTSTLKQLSLEDSIIKFISTHKTNVSSSSIERIRVSMNCLLEVVKATTPIKQIKTSDIEEFKKYYLSKEKPHKKGGINLNLRNIRTFLRWCVDEQMIKQTPNIKMLKEPRKKPKYLSEKSQQKLMSADNINNFVKRVFYLLLTTGCRRSEVIQGKLEGSMLIVEAHLSKTRIEKEIPLNDVQVKIVKELHKNRDTHLLKGYKLSNFMDYFSKAFVKACKRVGLGGYTLHNLRDTYAVTQWIVSNDIYEVKNLLGHTSVKTTERYAQFNMDRLAQDFPSSYQVRIEVEKVRKNGVKSTLIKSTFNQIEQSSSNNIGMS